MAAPTDCWAADVAEGCGAAVWSLAAVNRQAHASIRLKDSHGRSAMAAAVHACSTASPAVSLLDRGRNRTRAWL